MFRALLTFCLTAALCGCGDSAPPVGAGKTSGGPAVGAGPVGVAGDVSPDADNQKSKADSQPTEAHATADKSGDPKNADDDSAPAEEQPQKVTIEKAFEAANRAMQRRDVKQAIVELEKPLPENPDDLNLLINLAALNQRAASSGDETDYGAYKKAAEYMRRAMKADANLAESPNIGIFAGGIYYNEACALAKEDKPAEALKILYDALTVGFKNYVQLKSQVEKDDDLAAVRELPEYPEVMARAREIVLDKIFAENEPFEFTFDLTDIEGNAIAMSDLKGKIAIIDVWGTWCPPCRMEIPHFVELQDKYRDAGLEIVGLNSRERGDEEEVIATVKEFHKENKMNYRCALVKDEMLDQIPKMEGYPTTMFFDRAGKVRAKIEGYHDLDTLDGIIARLLSENADGKKDASDEKSEKETKADGAGN